MCFLTNCHPNLLSSFYLQRKNNLCRRLRIEKTKEEQSRGHKDKSNEAINGFVGDDVLLDDLADLPLDESFDFESIRP